MRILVFAGVPIVLGSFLLFQIGSVSTGVCNLPTNCTSGSVSHPFYAEAIKLALIGIAILIIGSVQAYILKTSYPKTQNSK